MQQTAPKTSTADELDVLEIAAIDSQRWRFGFISAAAIVVSFVHMATALILFSNESLIERGAALAMTGLVDVATWIIAEYLDYARRRSLARSWWVKILFGFALLISMFLNGAYLWANRPPEEQLPGWMSGGIAVTFALFTPMLIAVASLARGELTDDRLQRQQAATQERSATAQLAQAQAEAAQLTARVAQLEAEAAQYQATAAQAESRAAQLERQEQGAAAQWARVEAELRAALAEAEGQIAQLLAAGGLDRVAVAQKLISLGESQRAAAQFVGLKESTLRSRLRFQSSIVSR